MQPYHGVNTSLYSTLEFASIERLERAVILTDLGAYPEASQVFDEELYSCRLMPAVILARAELALRQFKLGLLFRILDEALTEAEKIDCDLDKAEFRLMYLLRAFAVLSCKGIKEPSLEEIYRAKEWLRGVPVSEYADIQVSSFHITDRTILERRSRSTL